MKKFENMDCMQGMKEYPDNHFDLAIVDPPYGLGKELKTAGLGKNIKKQNGTEPLLTKHISKNYSECQKTK